MKIRIFIATLAALFIGAAPAHAATTAQAVKAVKAEMRDTFTSGYPDVSCKKLTSTYFRCHWQILSGDWHEGTARVRFYGRTADVIGVS